MHVHSSLRLSCFEFSSLNEAFSVCLKVPMRFIQVDGHDEAQMLAHFCSIQLIFSHFALDQSVFGHFRRFVHFT